VRSPNAAKTLAAIAVVWLTTTTRMATAASAASTWSPLSCAPTCAFAADEVT